MEEPQADPRLDPAQTLTLRDLFLGTSFQLSLGPQTADPGSLHLTAWGQVATTQFSGRDGPLTLTGDVLSGTLGVDGKGDRWMAGLALAYNLGTGGFQP